jgi:hypothetical protein
MTRVGSEKDHLKRALRLHLQSNVSKMIHLSIALDLCAAQMAGIPADWSHEIDAAPISEPLHHHHALVRAANPQKFRSTSHLKEIRNQAMNGDRQ